MNGGNQGDQSHQNPMLRYYETWSSTTPAVARMSMMTIVGVYLFSWLIDLTMYIANMPYYTLYSFEVYRAVLSPLVGNSILTVLIIFLFFPTMASRLENGMGSGGFLALMAVFSVTTNVAFVVITFVMSILTSSQLPLFWTCQGFWTIIFPLMVVECMNQPEQPRRFLCFPVEIPSKYFPIALYAFFMLLGGPRVDDLLAIGVGYAYAYGYLDKLIISSAAIGQAEGEGVLKGAAQVQGWIPVGYAQGSGAWSAVSQQDPDGAGSGGTPWGGGLSQMMGGRGGADTAGSEMQESVFKSGTGHSLGGHVPASKEEIAAQRLAALERMEANGGTSGTG